MKQPEPAYSDLSLEQQVDARRRIYYYLSEAPRYFNSVRHKFFTLTESQVQGALDALAASGGAQLLEPRDGEKIGRWIAKERKR